MNRLRINRIVQKIKRNPMLTVRISILLVSLASLISAFSYLFAYNPEVYIRGVPFSFVLRSLAFGGLLTIVERFLRISEEITSKRKM